MKANGSKRSSGFTLIELMIVVAIIGILAAIAIPKFANLIRQSQEGSTKGNLGSIRSALSIYYGDNSGIYPGVGATSGDLASLTVSGKYLAAVPSANVQPYHGTVGSEVDVNSESGGLPTPTDTGGWLYDSTLNGQNLGGVWVNCTQTDTKGTIWTAY